MLSYIPLFIGEILCKFEKNFNFPQMKNFRILLIGLILCFEGRNISDINDNLRRGRDQSSLNRFLSHSPWKGEDLYKRREEIINCQIMKYPTATVYLIIDDSTMDKRYGLKMQGAGWHWSDSDKKPIWGHCIVSSFIVLVSEGKICFKSPLLFFLYRKQDYCRDENIPYRSKIDLACQIIEDYKPPAGTRLCVLVDRWYANKRLINKIREKNYDYVIPIKSNRIVTYKEIYYRVFRLGRRRHVWRKKKIGKQIFSTCHKNVTLPGIGIVKLVFSKLKGKGCKYLISNRLDWTQRKIISAYQWRWQIEVFYEDAKKHLGFDQYQMRNCKAILKWWELTFCAYILLILAFKNKTIGKAVISLRKLFLKSLLSHCYNNNVNSLLKSVLELLFV